MTERDWYPKLVDLAHQFNWRCFHQRPNMNRSGKWSSAIMGDPGWSDFTFCHAERGLFLIREIKGPRTPFSPGQREWLEALVAAGVDAKVWRMPRDWSEAVDTLTFGRGMATLV